MAGWFSQGDGFVPGQPGRLGPSDATGFAIDSHICCWPIQVKVKIPRHQSIAMPRSFVASSLQQVVRCCLKATTCSQKLATIMRFCTAHMLLVI
jgi:hypothetical protein